MGELLGLVQLLEDLHHFCVVVPTLGFPSNACRRDVIFWDRLSRASPSIHPKVGSPCPACPQRGRRNPAGPSSRDPSHPAKSTEKPPALKQSHTRSISHAQGTLLEVTNTVSDTNAGSDTKSELPRGGWQGWGAAHPPQQQCGLLWGCPLPNHLWWMRGGSSGAEPGSGCARTAWGVRVTGALALMNIHN